MSVAATAQTQSLNNVAHRGELLLEVSEAALTEPVTTETDVLLRAERLGGFVRFTATRNGVVSRSRWYQKSLERPHFVFGIEDSRFHEVDNRVLVKLSDPQRLDTIAAEIGAIRAKRYPGLGYSVLWLRSSHNPVETVRRLQSDQRVKQAELQFKRPLMMPL